MLVAAVPRVHAHESPCARSGFRYSAYRHHTVPHTETCFILFYFSDIIAQVWWGVLEGKNCLGHGGAGDGVVRNRNLFGNLLGTGGRREDLKTVASLEQACRRVTDNVASHALPV